jgi:hypothetical protein
VRTGGEVRDVLGTMASSGGDTFFSEEPWTMRRLREPRAPDSPQRKVVDPEREGLDAVLFDNVLLDVETFARIARACGLLVQPAAAYSDRVSESSGQSVSRNREDKYFRQFTGQSVTATTTMLRDHRPSAAHVFAVKLSFARAVAILEAASRYLGLVAAGASSEEARTAAETTWFDLGPRGPIFLVQQGIMHNQYDNFWFYWAWKVQGTQMLLARRDIASKENMITQSSVPTMWVIDVPRAADVESFVHAFALRKYVTLHNFGGGMVSFEQMAHDWRSTQDGGESLCW